MEVNDARGEERAWALADPARRTLYRYIATTGREVSRIEAAEALGLPVHVVKFQLDRLENDGLLEAQYRRPEGRGGPGAGRSTKWYRLRDSEVSVSVPPRKYDVVGDVLASAIDAACEAGIDMTPALTAAAKARGAEFGASARGIETALAAAGYEPRESEDGLELVNCPFHRLAQRHTELVCHVNLAFVDAMLSATPDRSDLQAQLSPHAGMCCVKLVRIRNRNRRGTSRTR